MTRLVVKVGGSLLGWGGLGGVLRRWLASNAAAETWIIAGGGPCVADMSPGDSRHRSSTCTFKSPLMPEAASSPRTSSGPVSVLNRSRICS